MKYEGRVGWLVVALKPISFFSFSDLENWKVRKLPNYIELASNFTLQTCVFAR